MNKIFRISTLLTLGIAAVLSSCAKNEFDTDQFSDDAVVFSALAPNPVARGAELRLYGSNLQNVKEVCIPGIEPITDIKVEKSGRMSEIRVIVPVDGPEVGKVSIVTKDGKTLSSHTDLSYSEPIILDEMTCASTVLSGDVLTFKGDYMNNIKEVVFEKDVYVTKFIEQSRYELKVAVPAAALSGKVAIGDVNEQDNPDGLVANLFYAENPITVGNPTVTSVDRGALNALDTIKVTGAHLDMVASVNFGGVDAYLEIAKDGKSLRTAVPLTAADGEVNLVTYTGNTISAGAYTTIVPGNLAVKAVTRYKAYKDAVITGNGLKLVTGITLGGAECSYVYSSKDNNITVTISEKATNGPFVLALANGKTVETAEIELVAPVVEEITPTELYAGDEDIIVKGTDLDLVTGVTLGGRDAEFEATGETKLAVKCVTTAVSGKIVLTLANGEKIEPETDITVNYHSLVIVTERPDAQHIGQPVTIKGVNMDLIENIYIGETKVTKYTSRTPDAVTFLVPWAKVGSYDISFHLFNGDIETQANKFEVQLELYTWYKYENEEGWEMGDWGGFASLAYGAFDWSQVPVGALISVEFELSGPKEWHQIAFRHGEQWGELPEKVFHEMGADETAFVYAFTATNLADLVANNGLIITGTSIKIKSIVITSEISQEKTLWTGPVDMNSYNTNVIIEPNNMFVDAGIEIGQKIRFYVTPASDGEWSMQIFDGHWGKWYHADNGNQITPDSHPLQNGAVVIEVDETVYTNLTTLIDWGGCGCCIVQGKGTLEKITLE